MAEGGKLETLVYCLGQIGGEHNPVITEGSAFATKHDYTKKGYARYVQEANNVIKFMQRVIDYFLESVKSEFEEDPLAFIDSESEEDLRASIQKMKKQWNDMFKEHQKKLKESLENQTLEESSHSLKPSESSGTIKEEEGADDSKQESTLSKQESVEESSTCSKQTDEDSSEESSSSSAKIPKLDKEAASQAGAEAPEAAASETTSESTTEFYELKTGYSEYTEYDTEGVPIGGSSGVPVESLEFPESIFIRKLKEFGRILKAEYQELRAKMGKTLDRINYENVAHDLKGFTLQRMEKFAKWKYALKALSHLVPELQTKLGELDLDFNKRKKNEKRLTDWMYFDDGKRDRKYHHRILIPMELTVSVEEISAIIWRQIRRYRKIKHSLESKLPAEYAAFLERVTHWKYEVLFNRPMKKPFRQTKSAESEDTYFNVEEMEEEAV